MEDNLETGVIQGADGGIQFMGCLSVSSIFEFG